MRGGRPCPALAAALHAGFCDNNSGAFDVLRTYGNLAALGAAHSAGVARLRAGSSRSRSHWGSQWRGRARTRPRVQSFGCPARRLSAAVRRTSTSSLGWAGLCWVLAACQWPQTLRERRQLAARTMAAGRTSVSTVQTLSCTGMPSVRPQSLACQWRLWISCVMHDCAIDHAGVQT